MFSGSRIPLSLSGPLTCVRHHIAVNEICASLNKTFPSFLLDGFDLLSFSKTKCLMSELLKKKRVI